MAIAQPATDAKPFRDLVVLAVATPALWSDFETPRALSWRGAVQHASPVKVGGVWPLEPTASLRPLQGRASRSSTTSSEAFAPP